MESPKQSIETLRNELNKHNHNYYVLSTPTISDGEFDKKMRELSDLELQYPEFDDPNSPSKRVGSDINKAFKQVEHIYPMLSLSNTYTQAEVQEFYNKVKKDLNDEFEIVCELKYDGTSISLTYQDGQLRQAITRGDGVRGDDVTDNVRTIRSIPLTLHGDDYPAQFEIRGEILMPWKVFEKLNVERAEREEQLFANPRNAASGTLKQQDSKVVAARKLDAYFYFLLGENLPIDGHYENLQKAQEWGFKISDATRKCKTVDEIFAFLAYWDIERKNLPVATDGVVLKVNSLRQQLNLGSTAKSPRWAIAYKFQTEREATKLLAVSYQVGRTGAITPVAQLEPVQLSGTKVQRASLYNADAIEALDLHIGDKVYVEKGGEIIPKIVDVDKAVRDLWSEKVVFVQTCPECGQPLQRVEGEAAYYCLNESACPPQVKGRIEHFLARRAMDIAGGGPETVEALFSANFIHNIADLYDLQWEQLATLERWAETSAKKLVDGIHESKNVPYARVLFALGIRHVGETVAKKLATAFPYIDLLMNATLEQLTAVDEIGERIALSLIAYFENPKNKEIINRLREAGLQFALTQDAMALRTNKLEGKTIVISGTFEKHSRDEYKNMIDLNGGKNSGSISAKTSFLLAGDNMGPAKLEKAEKLGIEILNADDFLKLLN